jgi:hypothetical protein
MKETIGLALVTALVALTLVGPEAEAQIPTPESVLGYEIGDWVTDYHGMESYLSALADASPRVIYDSYGTDYEHRTLRYVVVSSAENIQNLDVIRRASARLADPRGLDAAATAALIEETPLVVWLNYSTDGNETAGLESALMMAHHLAASDDETIERLLDEAVIVITPIMNPSSHERWAGWSNSFAAKEGNPDPRAMEHNPPWGVLTNNNHYLVDLNRESVWATQRESAALRALYYEWNPAIFVDHHGEYDNFTGPGYKEPLNPFVTEAQRSWLTRLGHAIGDRFGEHSWSYSPWETGTFYPGYWESIGLLNGAIGFTYETIGGGSKGLRYRRDDSSVITLRLAAEQHFEASLAVIEAAVDDRQELWREFTEYFRSALTLDRTVPEKAFIIEPSTDPTRTRHLLGVLMANRIDVFQTRDAVEAREVHDYYGNDWDARRIPAGSFVIPVAQPQARMLLTLMRNDLRLPDVTLADAREFRDNQEVAGFYNRNIASTTYLFYDVTAWSMPLTYDVPALWTERPVSVEMSPLTELTLHSALLPPGPGRYGYLLPGGELGSIAALIDLLQQDLVVNVAYSAFTIAGRSYPRGSLLVRNERNPDVDLLQTIGEVATRHAIDLFAVDSPHSDSGPSLGSDQFVYIKKPKVAVLAGDPVNAASFGDLWFNLERLYGLRFTAIDKDQLSAAALDDYDVLVLPHGWYGSETFSAALTEAIESWISRGGTLVCLKGAARWVANPESGLSSARMRPARWPLDGGEASESRETVAVPGAILAATPDPNHYLTFGYVSKAAVLVRSNLAFESDPELATPFRLAPAGDLRLAGFAYDDSLDRLAGTPFVIVDRIGSGKIVLFLEDPNFRVYWFGMHRLFLNSLLLAPSF